MDAKELGHSYNQPYHVIFRMKNYSARPSALPFLTSIPGKIHWAVLRAYGSIHEVHPSAKAIPEYLGISSLGKYIETIKGGELMIKEEIDTKDGDAGIQ